MDIHWSVSNLQLSSIIYTPTPGRLTDRPCSSISPTDPMGVASSMVLWHEWIDVMDTYDVLQEGIPKAEEAILPDATE